MKKIGIFLLIVVTFICTLQATWAYFKDTKTISSAFSSEGLLSNVSVEISNQSFDFDKGSTTATITVKNNSSVDWNTSSVDLITDIPTYTLNNQEYKLTNLFGTYYTVTIAKNIQEKEAVFTLTVKPKKAEGIDLRLGIADIKFKVSVNASYGKNNKPLTVHDSEDYIKIVTTPWKWPDNQNFKDTLIRDWSDNHVFPSTEYHTPMYYGPSAISGGNIAYSKNVFPSLRFVNDNVTKLMNGSELNYSEQLKIAEAKYPSKISYYYEDDEYSLVRGPVYFVPNKGFVSAYYMTWTGQTNEYGTINKNGSTDGNHVFKRLYLYNGKYYNLVRGSVVDEGYRGRYPYRYQYLHYKFYLNPINDTILDYVNNGSGLDNLNASTRFVIKDPNNAGNLIANYKDYNNQFDIGDFVYESSYGAYNLHGVAQLMADRQNQNIIYTTPEIYTDSTYSKRIYPPLYP